MKQVILSGLLVLFFYHLGYFNAIHTIAIAKESQETIKVESSSNPTGIPLYPPSYRELKGIKD